MDRFSLKKQQFMYKTEFAKNHIFEYVIPEYSYLYFANYCIQFL